jgi:NAD(P)-dependent dehydrogenase (short-subunit alcohol dehydrogenase family)
MLDPAHQAGGGREALDHLGRDCTTLGGIGDPEQTANAIVWLCSPAASRVTGTCIEVDGGTMAI